MKEITKRVNDEIFEICDDLTCSKEVATNILNMILNHSSSLTIEEFFGIDEGDKSDYDHCHHAGCKDDECEDCEDYDEDDDDDDEDLDDKFFVTIDSQNRVYLPARARDSVGIDSYFGMSVIRAPHSNEIVIGRPEVIDKYMKDHFLVNVIRGNYNNVNQFNINKFILDTEVLSHRLEAREIFNEEVIKIYL